MTELSQRVYFTKTVNGKISKGVTEIKQQRRVKISIFKKNRKKLYFRPILGMPRKSEIFNFEEKTFGNHILSSKGTTYPMEIIF